VKRAPAPLAASLRIYRALLRLYPIEFRRQYGPLMQQLFRDTLHDAHRERGRAGVAQTWLRTLTDLLVTIPVEHLAAFRQLIGRCGLEIFGRFRQRFSYRGVAMLHITNGESAAGSIRKTGLPGQVLAWNDVLHEGPAPADLSLDQLRTLRAGFIASQGWAGYGVVLEDFLHRDQVLEQFSVHSEVVLWFEHDLYDQLQLIQLLDWFAQRDHGNTTLSLICIGAFPGVANFHGLGELNPAQLRSLFPARTAITAEQLALGRAAWRAFCSPDPTTIEALLRQDTSALPFLHAALTRHLEQFPAVESGLSRTERQILQAIAAGKDTPAAIFRAEQAGEPAPFMGDSTLWSYLAALCDGNEPLLRREEGLPFALPEAFERHEDFLSQTLALTKRGQAVLAGQDDRLQSGIDRWLGGVHLHGADVRWRWDAAAGQLRVAPAR
jgi:hypothetical protein